MAGSAPPLERSGSSHVILPSELLALVGHINSQLKDDPVVGSQLPIDPPEKLFEVVHDGLLLSQLINQTVKDTIPERKLNKTIKTQYQAVENHNQTIKAARNIGCQVVNIGATDLMDSVANNTQHLVLGILWQIVKVGLMNKITIEKHPELIRLIRPGENLALFLEMPPEQLLFRWVNYHLKHAGSDREISNFSGDVVDSVVYGTLLSQIAPDECTYTLDELNAEADLHKRAEMVLSTAEQLHCRKFVTATDIVSGHSRLNLAFVANLFNHHPGIQLPTEEELALLNQSKVSLVGRLCAKLRLQEELYDALTKLKGQNQALATELATLQTTYDVCEQDREQMASETELLNELSNTLQERLDEVSAESNSLRSQVQTAASEARDHKQTAEVLQGFMGALQQEKDALQHKYDTDLEAAAKKHLEVARINKELLAEIERLKAELAEMTRQRDLLQEQLAAYAAANERGQKAYEEVQNEAEATSERVQALATANEMLKANLSASEANYSHHLGQLSKQNADFQRELDALKLANEELQAKCDTQADRLAKHEKQEAALHKMVQHLSGQVYRNESQLSHLRTLYNAFSNPRKLAKALYPGWSRQELEGRQGTDSPALLGALIRPAGDKHKESKPFFYVLLDNFLLGFKIDKFSEPSDVVRLDDCLLDRTQTEGSHIITITTAHVEHGVYSIQIGSETEADSWYSGLQVAQEWWADNKFKRQKAFSVSPHTSKPNVFTK